jgi:hypothetical protein
MEIINFRVMSGPRGTQQKTSTTFLCVSGYVRKSMRNQEAAGGRRKRPRDQQSALVGSWPVLVSICEGFHPEIGQEIIFGPKSTDGYIFGRFGAPLGFLLGSRGDPNGSKTGPRAPLPGPKDPKGTPRHIQDGPRSSKLPFWNRLGSCWCRFRMFWIVCFVVVDVFLGADVWLSS